MARILTFYKCDDDTYNKSIVITDLEGEALYKWAMIEALKDLELANTVDEYNDKVDDDAKIDDNTTLEELESILNQYSCPSCLLIMDMDDNTTIYSY